MQVPISERADTLYEIDKPAVSNFYKILLKHADVYMALIKLPKVSSLCQHITQPTAALFGRSHIYVYRHSAWDLNIFARYFTNSKIFILSQVD